MRQVSQNLRRNLALGRGPPALIYDLLSVPSTRLPPDPGASKPGTPKTTIVCQEELEDALRKQIKERTQF